MLQVLGCCTGHWAGCHTDQFCFHINNKSPTKKARKNGKQGQKKMTKRAEVWVGLMEVWGQPGEWWPVHPSMAGVGTEVQVCVVSVV